MTAQQVLQVSVGCVAAGTPWLVARVALAVAARHAIAVGAPFPPPRAMARLTRATVLVLPVVIAAGFLLTPPSLLMGAIDIGAFALLAVFGLGALGEIDAASRPAREVSAAERAASLRPRRLSDYLPLPVRLVPFVVTAAGLLALGWRLSVLSPNRLLVPLSFILAAPVFLWLYEVWMRAEISGDGSVGNDIHLVEARRQRRVRHILTVETILVIGLIGVGHALLGLKWSENGWLVALGTTTGAILGILGCALALSSELNRRRYREAGSGT